MFVRGTERDKKERERKRQTQTACVREKECACLRPLWRGTQGSSSGLILGPDKSARMFLNKRPLPVRGEAGNSAAAVAASE